MTDPLARCPNLAERVRQFNAMHMGTSYLVNDLWREVQALRDTIRNALVSAPFPAQAERLREIAGQMDGSGSLESKIKLLDYAVDDLRAIADEIGGEDGR